MSIVITGNPGVGKHTITQELGKKMNCPIVDINRVARNSGLFEKNGDTNDIDTDRLAKILEQEISRQDIVVGHLAPYVLRRDQVRIVIVLRKSPYDLVSVYMDRGYSDEKIKENAGSEILGVITHDAIAKFQDKTFQVNVTGKTVAESVDDIMSVIKGRRGEQIDWLDLVRGPDSLKGFFAD